MSNNVYIFKSEFLQEKDVIVATTSEKPPYKHSPLNGECVFRGKIEGQGPTKRVMYLGEMVTARVLTKVKSCVFAIRKNTLLWNVTHAGAVIHAGKRAIKRLIVI